MYWEDKNLIETLQKGGVAVMPTDTLYGIVGRAEDREVVERIYQARKRNPSKPCIILIGSLEQLQIFGVALTKAQQERIKQFTEPTSFILDCSDENLEYLHRGTKSLSFRLPQNEDLKKLLIEAGPLIAPSANLEGENPAKNIKEAKNYFNNLVDLYVDGGMIEGQASKIIRLNPDGSETVIRPFLKENVSNQMQILENYDLTNLNTFRVSARAKFFVEVNSEAELKELFQTPEFKNNKKLFLGGGSNVLFTKDWEGIVILNKIKGVEVVNENKQEVLVRAMSGEVWHDVVEFSVARGWWGIENLAYIPGSVGAAPMQNIGAYGAELKNTLVSIEVYDVNFLEKRVFTSKELNLGYRDSVFKNSWKGQYFILSITLKLSKLEKKNISYKILNEFLKEKQIDPKTSKEISDVVTQIRKSKLPDPHVIGNAGSFFKNVFVNPEKFTELLKIYPDMPSFKEGNLIKIPSAWLIESVGWKGKKFGNAGVHDKQALVLVNHGSATGAEIKNLAEEIQKSVLVKFGIEIETEVNII